MYGNGHIESEVSKNFYRIGEVSRLTDTKPFVLRYWETEFPMLQPVKSPKGHRLYRREDVDTVLRIKRLLYDEGFTIAGARRHLREEGDSPDAVAEDGPSVETASEAHAREDYPPDGALFAEDHSTAGERPRQDRSAAQRRAPAAPMIGRNVLLDLRDALRAFLTLLESE